MILELLNNKYYEKAYLQLITLHPHDQAEILKSLSEEDQTNLLSYLTDIELSEILSYLDPEDSALIVMELDVKRQKNVLDQMEIDDAVDLIEELEIDDQEALLNILEEKTDLIKLLNYEDDQAGSLMTLDFIEIKPSMDVKDAMKVLISKAPDVESITTLFVVDEYQQYVGTVNLNQLIKAKSPLLIEDLVIKTPHILDTNDIDMTIHLMREYGLHEVAVCNDELELIGIVTLDDVIEAYTEESIEDFAKLSAVSDTEDKGLIKSSLHRLPWLIILLIASIPIALASSMFEEIILAISILSLFQPLILDASGDVATQTLAVTLRKLNQTDGASLKDGITEVITGSINGVVLGLTSAVITFFMAKGLNMSSPILVSLVVGISLLLTIIIGPILGFIVPVTLNKLKIDPAVASGPFITTLVDILSSIIYFGLATLLLGGVVNV